MLWVQFKTRLTTVHSIEPLIVAYTLDCVQMMAVLSRIVTSKNLKLQPYQISQNIVPAKISMLNGLHAYKMWFTRAYRI